MNDTTSPASGQLEPVVAIKQALDVLFEPGDVFEVRIPKQAGRTISGYFDDTATAAALIHKEDSKTYATPGSNGKLDPRPSGIYVTLNPVLPALVSRSHNCFDYRATVTTTDGEIATRRWLPIDLDPKRPTGISSTQAELDAAIAKASEIKNWLDSLGWPAPLEAISGNGAHLLYAIDLPNDDESRGLCEAVTKMLGGIFTDDAVTVDQSVWNASRIWKVYGTLAAKGSDTPDRPHRVAEVTSAPPRVNVTPGMLAVIADGYRNASEEHFKDKAGEFIPDMVAWLKERKVEVTPAPPRPFGDGGKKWSLVCCPFNEAHKGPMVALNSRNRPIFKCLHNSCSAYTWKEFREKIDPDFLDPEVIKRRLIDWCTGSEETPSQELIENALELKAKRGKIMAEVRKVVAKKRYDLLGAAINEAARERKIFATGSEFSDKGNILGAIAKVREWQEAGVLPQYWTSLLDGLVRVGVPGDIEAALHEEHHDLNVMMEFHRVHEIWVKPATAGNIIKAVAQHNVINPLKHYLESFKWDGTQRLDGWLQRYMGCADGPYERAAGKKWLISLVARGVSPGCQADHMLILEGEQGIGKSQCLRVIGGDFYIEFSRAISANPTAQKDFVHAILNKLVVEMSELATLRQAQMEALKAIITTPMDTTRLSYGRHAKEYPRSCVLAGTTNELEGGYIADASGARRFWPVRCGATGAPDIAGLREVRDQLIAEAVQVYKSGEDWWKMPEEETLAAQEAIQEEKSNANTDAIRRILLTFLRQDALAPVIGFEDAPFSIHSKLTGGMAADTGLLFIRARPTAIARQMARMKDAPNGLGGRDSGEDAAVVAVIDMRIRGEFSKLLFKKNMNMSQSQRKANTDGKATGKFPHELREDVYHENFESVYGVTHAEFWGMARVAKAAIERALGGGVARMGTH